MLWPLLNSPLISLGLGAGSHRAEQELLGTAPLPQLDALGLTPEDAISPAGTVQSLLEGVIVVRVSVGRLLWG